MFTITDLYTEFPDDKYETLTDKDFSDQDIALLFQDFGHFYRHDHINQVIGNCSGYSNPTEHKCERPCEIPPNKVGIDIRSDKKKIVMAVGLGMFHVVTDSFICFYRIQHLLSNKDVQLVLDIANINRYGMNSFVNLYEKFFNLNNIDYKIIDSNNYDYVLVNNFILYQDYSSQLKQTENSLLDFNQFIQDNYGSDIEPFRKVYIGRSEKDKNVINYWQSNPDHSNFPVKDPLKPRMVNETMLEEFLKDNGFEIVIPENDFESIAEQIKFMTEVKTLISVTSSGIANCLYMKKGGNVIELRTSFKTMTPVGENIFKFGECLHNQYSALSYSMDHNYYMIHNKDREAETMIKKLNNSKILSIL